MTNLDAAPSTDRRVAWFNCQAGVAGDMTMAALVDAGADRDVVAQILGGLGLDGYALMFERVQRCGVGATWANVVVHDHGGRGHQDHDHDGHGGDREDHGGGDHGGGDHPAHRHGPAGEGHQPHRPARDVFAMLEAADLPERVRRRSLDVYRRLADVEGAIHGIDADDVELHEVGALDSIIDVVGVCAALEALDIDEIRCSPIAVGTGSIRSAHGIIPNPAPATVALLTGALVPIVGLDTTLEVSTPTGAALMTTLASGFGAMPPITPRSVGYGAGTADPAERANVVQVVVGTAGPASGDGGSAVTLLEANVDDVTGEVLAHTVAALLDAGAHDAWITPIVMKKGRPAHVISTLCDPAAVDTVRGVLVRETGTLGVRAASMRRWPQRRSEDTVDVDGHPVRIKRAEHRIKVEFDDAAAAGIALGLPVRVVIERATSAAHGIDAAGPSGDS